MRRYIFFSLGAFAVLLVLGGMNGAQQPPKTREFMLQKLEHSQEILDGLVRADFDAMAKHSQQMSLLTLDASWQVLESAEYAHRSQEFRRATDALTTAAKEKNLDGAALAYIDVTMKCVNCHKYIRDSRKTRD